MTRYGCRLADTGHEVRASQTTSKRSNTADDHLDQLNAESEYCEEYPNLDDSNGTSREMTTSKR